MTLIYRTLISLIQFALVIGLAGGLVDLTRNTMCRIDGTLNRRKRQMVDALLSSDMTAVTSLQDEIKGIQLSII